MGIDVEGEARKVAEQIIGGIAVGQKWSVQSAAESITTAMKRVSGRENAELGAEVERVKTVAIIQLRDMTAEANARIETVAKLREERDELRSPEEAALFNANEAVKQRDALRAERDRLVKENAVLQEQNFAMNKTCVVGSALAKAAQSLAVRVGTYRLQHDLHGGGDIRTGRAWDQMKHAEDATIDSLTAWDAMEAGGGS